MLFVCISPLPGNYSNYLTLTGPPGGKSHGWDEEKRKKSVNINGTKRETNHHHNLMQMISNNYENMIMIWFIVFFFFSHVTDHTFYKVSQYYSACSCERVNAVYIV